MKTVNQKVEKGIVCIQCGAFLQEIKCKLKCSRCGYFEDCPSATPKRKLNFNAIAGTVMTSSWNDSFQ